MQFCFFFKFILMYLITAGAFVRVFSCFYFCLVLSMLILISFSTRAVYILKPNREERHKISMDGTVGDGAEDSVFSTLSIYLTWHTQGTILYFPMSIFSSSFFEVNLNIIYLCLLARYTLLAPISASLDVGTDVVLAVPNNCLNFCKGQWKKI